MHEPRSQRRGHVRPATEGRGHIADVSGRASINMRRVVPEGCGAAAACSACFAFVRRCFVGGQSAEERPDMASEILAHPPRPENDF